MRKHRKWVMSLGLLAAAPAAAWAGPLSFLPFGKSKPPAVARQDNQKIAEAIARALRQARLTGYDIEIEFRDGVARLKGKIKDAAQKAKATRVVAAVPGVRSVDNRLEPLEAAATQTAQSKPAESADSRSPLSFAEFAAAEGAKKHSIQAASGGEAVGATSNQQLAERVAAALKQANLSGYDMEIRVRDGVVTLKGSVATQQERERVDQVVASVAGVRSVDNRLAVDNGQRASARYDATTNQRVAERIAAVLKQSPLRGYDIDVRFKDGVALLSGTVPTPEAAAYVAQLVSSIPEVRTIESRLVPLSGPAFPLAAMPPAAAASTAPLPGLPVPTTGGARPIHPAAYQGAPNVPADAQAMPPAPPAYAHPGQGPSHVAYNLPRLPEYAWPSYAAYPNSAQLTYPTEYAASAWPYIGPFYPYPQIPLGWRQVQLEWDDGYWNLNFRPRTDRWWWFIDPKNW